MAKADEAQDELADVPPHEFVKARNALVARLQKDGDTAAAKAVAAMKRPLVTVWAVNRLARESSDTVEELIESADRMKQAQLGHGGAATDLGAATTRHRAVLGKLARRAQTMLGSAGIRSSAELLRRIETTLTAAASDKDLRAALRKGRIEQELAPVGFEVFGGATPAPRAADATVSSAHTSNRRLSVVKPQPAEHGTQSRTETRSEARVAAAEEAKRRREAAADEARRRRAEMEAAIERLRDDVRAASIKVSEANEQLRQSTAAVREARLAEKAARDAMDAALKRARQRDT
jgi:hypothetical protein